jgi:predicted enzyme related to lactoylglutathione lyase
MGQPVVHFEVIGKEPEKLRSFYGGLFDWEFDTNALVSDAVSEAGNYGFVDRYTTDDGTGIRGGVGGGGDYRRHVLVYVAVPSVEDALETAERLGGKRVLGPEQAPGGDLVIGQFVDPEGNLMGVAGRA